MNLCIALSLPKKKKEMNELRRKFDEDKARVERMRHSRKFKPY